MSGGFTLVHPAHSPAPASGPPPRITPDLTTNTQPPNQSGATRPGLQLFHVHQLAWFNNSSPGQRIQRQDRFYSLLAIVGAGDERQPERVLPPHPRLLPGHARLWPRGDMEHGQGPRGLASNDEDTRTAGRCSSASDRRRRYFAWARAPPGFSFE